METIRIASMCVLLLQSVYENEGGYCEILHQHSKEPGAFVNVCQNNTATNLTINLDSSSAPSGDITTCECILTHFHKTTQVVWIGANSNDQPGVEFEIMNSTFNQSRSAKLDLDTGSIILFRQKESNHAAVICIQFSARALNASAMTLKCLQNHLKFPVATTTSIPVSSVSTTITTSVQNSFQNHSSFIMTPSPKPNDETESPVSTESLISKGDNADKEPNSIMVGGVAGGGVLLIAVVIAIVIVRKRRKDSKDNAGEKEGQSEDIRYGSEDYITTNVHYVSADAVMTERNREKHKKQNLSDGDYERTLYSVVMKPRMTNKGSDGEGAENGYNHLHETELNSVSDNVYNKREALEGENSEPDIRYDTLKTSSPRFFNRELKQQTNNGTYDTVA